MIRTQEILKTIPEESTGVFRCIFKDESGELVQPASLYVDLTALDGTVIFYNRQIPVAGSTVNVVVTGSDTRILQDETSYGERLLTIRAVYNSTNGNGLSLNKQIKFRIQNLRMKGYPLSLDVSDTIFTDDYVREVA